MRVKISVTESDIKNGKKKINNSCPIALAAKRLIKEPQVFYDSMSSEYSNDLWDLPKEAQLFVEKFDSGKEVKPFSFSINVSTKYLKK